MGAVVSTRQLRWAQLLGGEELKLGDNAGRVGLRNLGNTCFMNAGLQCLSHLEPFAAYFLTGKYREEVSSTNPSGSRGKLARAFASLQRGLWQSGQTAHNPRELHAALAPHAPHLFQGYEQQDVQEFLAFCLDALHEDLNLAALNNKSIPAGHADQESEEDSLSEGRGEEFAAALAWMRYLRRGKSFLVDLFQGQLRSSLHCEECQHQARTFEPFLYLSVPVPRETTSARVVDALDKYLESELLTGDERWLCPKCDRKVNARKKIDLWVLPPVLVLHLKRFEFDSRALQFRKIGTTLTAPLTLDLSAHVQSPQRETAVYDVVAVANHAGAYGSGHYTAVCQVSVGGGSEWNLFDDERVIALSDHEVVTREAYVIFLVRRATDGEQLRRQSITLPEVWPHSVSRKNSALLELISNQGSVAAQAAQAAQAYRASHAHQASQVGSRENLAGNGCQTTLPEATLPKPPCLAGQHGMLGQPELPGHPTLPGQPALSGQPGHSGQALRTAGGNCAALPTRPLGATCGSSLGHRTAPPSALSAGTAAVRTPSIPSTRTPLACAARPVRNFPVAAGAKPVSSAAHSALGRLQAMEQPSTVSPSTSSARLQTSVQTRPAAVRPPPIAWDASRPRRNGVR